MLSNFTLTFLVVGLIASRVALMRAPKSLTAPVVVEALFTDVLIPIIGFVPLWLQHRHERPWAPQARVRP